MKRALQSLVDDCQNCGVHLTTAQQQKVLDYLHLLEKWRRRINLSSIADVSEMLRFHFLEAFWAYRQFLPKIQRLADIGSGAGFPGMVIKLYQPSLSVVLIERNYRKSLFLRELARHLSLDVTVYSGSAEDFPDWPAIEAATIKALKPSKGLLLRLATSGTLLLSFEGQTANSYPGWNELKRATFPFSRNRSVALLRPQRFT